jgi:hypothetical protein
MATGGFSKVHGKVAINGPGQHRSVIIVPENRPPTDENLKILAPGALGFTLATW